jgi:8-oxo-dGTP pyrophosphatase MutT (NUDIX family)
MTSPEEIPLSFHFSKIPETFIRGDRALIVLKDVDGKFILGCKHVYPNGIYRLAGGGIEEGEDPTVAACRELEEELGIKRDSMKLAALLAVHITSPEKTTNFRIYLYETTLKTNEVLSPEDDIDDVIHLTREEMNALVDRFYDLPDEADFSWSNYGKIYGRVHEIALQQYN